MTGRRALICVLHDSADLLPELASSVQRQLDEDAWTVVLVDSGSRDGSAEAARRLLPASAVVELGANHGYAAGINAGIRHVVQGGGADAYVVMNPDVKPRDDCLDRLVGSLGSAGAGLAAPRLLDEHGRLLPSLRRVPTFPRALADGLLGGPLAHRLRLPTEVIRSAESYQHAHALSGWATGGLLAFSSHVLAHVGYWDESYFLYEEEVDFCLRALDRGIPLRYEPGAEAVRHIGEQPVTPWAEALMRTNRVRHVQRRSGLARAAGHYVVLLLATGLRALRGRANARAAAASLLTMRSPESIMKRYAQG